MGAEDTGLYDKHERAYLEKKRRRLDKGCTQTRSRKERKSTKDIYVLINRAYERNGTYLLQNRFFLVQNTIGLSFLKLDLETVLRVLFSNVAKYRF